MIRSTLFGCVVVLAVAACSNDNGGNNNGDDVCGDGERTGTEQCDDGNTAAGDGCSATCRNESSGPVCGDGVTSSPETCDDSNTTSGDGCSSTCQDEAPPNDCGNGQLDANEDCDDNNTLANDGCTACSVDNGWTCNNAEPSVCTMVTPPNGACTTPFSITFATNGDGDLEGHAIGNTTGGTNMFAAGACNGADAGGSNDHTYSITLATAADLWIRGPQTPAFDMVIRLTTTACMQSTQVPDDVGADGCSNHNPEDLYYVNLPAGTYYLTVDGNAAAVGAYDVTVIAFAQTTCGDGEVDEGEECDDMDTTGGDGCDGRCDVEAGYSCDEADENSPSVCEIACGNDEFDPEAEECEYVVGVNDDVCTATCTLRSDVAEAEPNNTAAQAQTLTEANHRVRGSLSSAADVDLYKFTLTQPAIVEFETYNASDEDDTNYGGFGLIANIDCYYSADTTLALFDATDDVTMDDEAIALDDDDGDVFCSYLGPQDGDDNIFEGILEPGTYIVRVTALTAQPRYILDMFITPAKLPVAGDLVINEYMGDDDLADTNCDGSTANTDDEFIELVNTSNTFLNINGVRIHDASSTPLRHTFATGPTGFVGLLPGDSVVVWGGGAPACEDVFNFFESSQNSLALNNAGDSIIILPAGVGTTPIVQTSFTDAQLFPNVSNNLSPDLTGSVFTRHNLVTGAVGNFSPGFMSDQSFFPME
jgi:cysteine-rich repeat protein